MISTQIQGKKQKNNLKKYFFKLMNNTIFGKTMEDVRKNSALVTTERRTNYLVLELNYHITKFFTENLLATEMKKQRYL